MTDLKTGPVARFLREPELREAMELLFFAYRDFTGDSDRLLGKYGYGRAHRRVIYFVGRNPGITVSELLAILRITKQSLSRVLAQVLRKGLVEQRPGATDRRRRHLHLTDAGRALEQELSTMQMRRLSRAFAEAGTDAMDGFRRLMLGIIGEDDRARFAAQKRAAAAAR
ncbi:MAG: MarR family transcriptional regulator [Alphaproteobacteria bacterium]|nr:MarR family transcriptional regulator [Alphaproteobacteria bacterium]